MKEEIKNFHSHLEGETTYQYEHISAQPFFKTTYGINREGCVNTSYSHRIYINTPTGDVGYQFVNEYIKKCFDNEIPYDMKAFFNGDDSFDKTIIYSNNDYFTKHVEILEKIAREHPDWIKNFGTPVHSTVIPETPSNKSIQPWYGITLGQGKGAGWGTANDYFDELLNISYLHFCYNYMPEIRGRFKSNFSSSPKPKVDQLLDCFLNQKWDHTITLSPAFYFLSIESITKDNELMSYCGKRMAQVLNNPEKKDKVLETIGNTVEKFHSLIEIHHSEELAGIHPAISKNMVNLYEKDEAIRK